MFVRQFFYRLMTEEPGDGGKGGAGGGAGAAADELVELNIGGTVHKVPKAVQQEFGVLNKNIRTLDKDYTTLKETAANAKGTEYQELLAKIQELELEKLPEKERETARLNGELAKLKGLHETVSKDSVRYKTLFYENAIQTALNSALSGHDLYDTEQTAQLLRVYGQPKLVEDPTNGSYKIVLNMDFDGNGVQEYDPKEGAAKWLGLPKNANLLKNNLNPGAGTSTKTGQLRTDGTVTYKRADLQKPEVRKERAEKIKAGVAVTIID
ncbi:hypothetical protein [Leptospira stimsonii]|uniref:Uncharacterized protein n=1 Tax=Leptospira stimsonii TaxID=2202203 RepID=A0ABY2N8W7_9LEPT|nr:hypothetical protein [Leptospira stimsonii]TGK12851.1 hypothetical protein EHO98_19635 [Leptospira stimsonii]TGM18795.1 hypothetical protein EHQ90_06405 [Leptospira stimsonii]